MTAVEAPWAALAVMTTVAVLLAVEALRERLRRQRDRNRWLADVFAHNATKAQLKRERKDRDAAEAELARLRVANEWLRREAQARFVGVMADWLALDVKDCPARERLDGAP